ncbi:MAG: cell division protein FtsA [Alphaproteobacteria bacterium]|nr:cell division protein FtsA [Alphaproteobacteria bacterium]
MSGLAQRAGGRDRSLGRSPLVAALDIGTSKITCMISRRSDTVDGEPLIAAAGVQATRGMRAGTVVDLDALERSIRLAVEQAERVADQRINDVVVGVSGPDIRSNIVRAKTQLSGREVVAQHVREVREAALEGFQAAGRRVLHSSSLSFTVDGMSGVRDPRGMCADVLSASFVVVSAPQAGLRNIVKCIGKAHLNPVALVSSCYASGLSVLVEDEAQNGVVVIDLGGGVTSAAAFDEGDLVHIETLPIGCSKATADLAQGLGTTNAAAERLKTLYGAVALTDVDAFELVEAPRLGADGRLEAAQCTRADIVRILRPRIEELFELVDSQLSRASAAGRPLPRRIVLTGGGSQLVGIREVAEDVFRAPVRLARPANVRGLGEVFGAPAFSSAAGLVRWEMLNGLGALRPGQLGGEGDSAGMLRSLAVWLKENF